MPFEKGYTPWNKKYNGRTGTKLCDCGCDLKMAEYDERGRPLHFIYGHGNKNRKFPQRVGHTTGFKKGRVPWNKGKTGYKNKRSPDFVHPFTGKKHSDEARRNMSKAQRGRIATYKGELHWKWKGGITSGNKLERNKFRKTIGKDVLSRDGYKCVECGGGGYLHAAHIKGWADYPELRFDPDNCRTLCNRCHYKETFGKEMPENVKWGVLEK